MERKSEFLNLGGAKQEEVQRMIEISKDEIWTDFLEEANGMFLEEKKMRHDGTAEESSAICQKILNFAFDKSEIVRTREFLLMLCNRRGQSQKASTDMFKLVTETFIDKLPNREEKFKMLEAQRTASEGKMFLEREYSQCTTALVKMLEEDGKIDAGCDIIQEIQIETYGSLESAEKVEFILYQMKLVLARNDFVRCQILSRKISNRALNEKGIEASKIQYYKNMVQYYVHEKELLEAAKAYQLIYDTINKATPEEAAVLEARYPNDRVEAFQNFVLYLLISSYDQAKVDLLKVVESTYPRELEKQENEKISSWVKKMLNFELMMIQEDKIESEMQVYEPFKPTVDTTHRHIRAFLQQLCQHNLRVLEKYYSRISLRRVGGLLGVSQDRVEAELGDMVVNNRIKARINRLEGIVTFQQRKQFTNERLGNWNESVAQILDKVEQTCHFINREKINSAQ